MDCRGSGPTDKQAYIHIEKVETEDSLAQSNDGLRGGAFEQEGLHGISHNPSIMLHIFEGSFSLTFPT